MLLREAPGSPLESGDAVVWKASEEWKATTEETPPDNVVILCSGDVVPLLVQVSHVYTELLHLEKIVKFD
jgi:hypothetical protein